MDKLTEENVFNLDFPDCYESAENAKSLVDLSDAIETTANGLITRLWYQPFFNALKKEYKELPTTALLEFMRTLVGRNKSGGNNGISRLQYMLNAFTGESMTVAANPSSMGYIQTDHEALIRGSHGLNDPDLFFIASSGDRYTIEEKIFASSKEYHNKLNDTNFHNADYALVFLITEQVWKFSRKVDNYTKLNPVAAFSSTDPWLLEINCPTYMPLVSFFCDGIGIKAFRELTDDKVPEKVKYTIYDNIVIA